MTKTWSKYHDCTNNTTTLNIIIFVEENMDYLSAELGGWHGIYGLVRPGKLCLDIWGYVQPVLLGFDPSTGYSITQKAKI